ncbi:protein synthesis inhibitor PD-S2-like [Silene latifolia]|uniref:protein synthesis inhibitor PD-S2-like n=1 Tax=Silene latifolia TaxID=37657 RepID=UPI003D780DAC
MGIKQLITLFFVTVLLFAFTQLCVSTQTLTLNLNGTPTKVAYNKLINEIRQFAKGKLEYDGIPMMQAPSVPPAYIVVKLLAKRGATDVSLSVAINKTNLYVVGYADESLKKAFFFSESGEAEPSIFPGQLVKEILSFGSGYGALGKISGLDRENLIFSLDKLKFSMLTLHGEDAKKPSFIHDQATFLIYAIQAFSEAARFKYVQKKFFTPTKTPPEPDHKVPKLENAWETISKAVKIAVVKRKFVPPLILAHADGSTWVVNTVDEIKPDMGILLYVSTVSYPVVSKMAINKGKSHNNYLYIIQMKTLKANKNDENVRNICDIHYHRESP